MELNKVLAELKKERDLLDRAIAHLERLSTGSANVSSRPPGRPYAQPKRPEKARGAGFSQD